MKKIIIFIILLFPISIKAISASSYIAMSLDSEVIFSESNSTDERLIASITKILTAITVIENADLDEEVVVGNEVLKAYGSAVYLEVGEKLTIKDLLYGLILRSGNDCALELAYHTAGSMENFAMLMNELALKIGMNNSSFVNSSGLEESDNTANKSTAKDMAILTKYAMQNDTFKEIFKTKTYTLKTNKKTYSWTSKNKLLLSEDYITGGKTGYTKKAKRTLVTTASRNNLNVVIVTLNDSNDFLDHKTLYEEIFKNYKAVKVLDKKLDLNNEVKYKDDTFYLDDDIYIPMKVNDKRKINIKYNLYDLDKYNDNDIVGKVSIYLDDELVKTSNIYVNVKKKTTKSLLTKIKDWFKW